MSSNPLLTETHWSECEQIIRRFEAAWQDHERPPIESFLPADASQHTRLLVELIHVDLEFRTRAGEDARVEDYLTRFPTLADAAHTLDLIRAEFALRHRYLGPVAPEEYWQRFPEHLGELQILLDDNGRPAPLTPTRPAGSLGIPLTVTPSVPGYDIQGELGRGGMGVVYKARDVVLHRTVALKTLASVPGSENCARFAREAEAIARLDHPHIVPVYEVGEWRAGETVPPIPFFVMKWYPGGSLDAAAAGPGTNPAAHAWTVEVIAQAVHHAHQRGVLHRDLKPSNILLDEEGRPHVADFGLAGRLNPDGPQTLTGGVVGTPSYMAPEQARTPKQATTAADVYGLGAILYHQLTGLPPFDAASPLATLDMVANAPPARPSVVNPSVPRDLETICLKCLEKDPARRYATAAALAEDLERWRTGRPVLARSTATWEHVWRWVRRHPLVAGMALTTAAALVVAVVTLARSNATTREKEREAREAYISESAMRYKLEESIGREKQSLYTERVASAGRLYAANQLPQAWALLDPCPEHLRRWEWRYLDSLRQSTPAPLIGHEYWVRAAAFLADDRLATGDQQGVVRIWDTAARTTSRTWTTGQDRVYELAAHPTRPWLAAAGLDSVVVWNADTGEPLHRLRGGLRVGFSPCGRWAVTADRTVARVWSLPDWSSKWDLTDPTANVSSFAFTPDGNRLLTGTRDGTIRTWDMATGAAEPTTWKRPRSITGLAFTADGAALIEAHSEGVVVADPATGRHLHRVDPTGNGRSFMAVGATPGWVGVTGPDAQVIVWDANRRRSVRVYHGHTVRVTALAFSRDGKRMASGGGDLTVRVWDLTRQTGVRTLAEPGMWSGAMTTSPDGSRIAVGPRYNGNPADYRVLILDAETGRELRRLPAAGGVAFHPDSRRLAVGRPGGGIVLWDLETGAELWNRPPAVSPHGPAWSRLVFSPCGSRLAVWEPQDRVQLLDVETGVPAGTIDTAGEFVRAMEFSPDGSRLAVAMPAGLGLWDVRSLTRVRQSEPGAGAYAIAFSPDGRWLATADRDRIVRIRDAVTCDSVRTLVGGAARVNALAYGPDGGRLVTGGAECVRVWDAESGRELISLPGVHGTVMGVAWDRKRDRVVALDDSVRVWSADAK